MRLFLTGALVCALLACDRGKPEKPEGPVLVPGTGPTAGKVVPSPVAPTLPIGLPEIPPTVPEPMPLVITQPTACDPCSLVLEHDLEALRAGKACDLCGAADPTICEGWPEPGMVECDTYDWLRNCIYARLGYDFNTAEEWRVTFEQESWYVPDPKFRWERVTPLQTENARVLRELVKRKRCID